MKKRHYWTLSEMEKVYEVWESQTVEDIAKKFSVSPSQVQSLATAMRKSGIKLPYKHRKGYLRPLMEELKKKLKIK